MKEIYQFHDWLFNFLINFLVNLGWVIIIRDFKKSENRKEKNYVGLTHYRKRIIFIDKYRGTPKVLVHELFHLVFKATLEQASSDIRWKDLAKVRGRSRSDKEYAWRELRTLEFERLFYPSLNRRQIKILQDFIDDAMSRYEEDVIWDD